jgi:hypothetical protein
MLPIAAGPPTSSGRKRAPPTLPFCSKVNSFPERERDTDRERERERERVLQRVSVILPAAILIYPSCNSEMV